MQRNSSDPAKAPGFAGPAFLHLKWSAAGLILGLFAGGFVVWMGMRPGEAPPMMRFVLALPRSAPLAEKGNPLAISADGAQFVYTAQAGDGTQLYLRTLDKVEPRPIEGTSGAYNPFFAPDGLWTGFFDARDFQLKKVPATGGKAQVLCRAQFGLGASWGDDGTIIYSPDVFSGLWRIPAEGGKSEPLTQLAQREFTHRWPQFLPGGKSVLFTVGTAGASNTMSLAALNLKTGKRKAILENASDARFVPSGHLFFLRGVNLMAVRFDPANLETEGEPFLVKQNIATDQSVGAGHFAVARTGMLAYAMAEVDDDIRSLAWADRQGSMERITINRGAFSYPRLSPDGRLLALVIESLEETSHIWILEVATGAFRRLPTEGNNLLPAWTPDGKRICFASDRLGQWQIFWMPADGSAPPELLYRSDNPVVPNAVSSDGRYLAFTEFAAETGADIWILSLEGGRSARLFLRTPYAEWGGSFSPDMRWLAYTSNDSGLAQVYVRPFPGSGERLQISAAEGREPVWSRDGSELFFRGWNGIMGVSFRASTEAGLEPPRLVAGGEYESGDIAAFPNYDVAADGSRFVVIPREQREKRVLYVDLNWLAHEEKK